MDYTRLYLDGSMSSSCTRNKKQIKSLLQLHVALHRTVVSARGIFFSLLWGYMYVYMYVAVLRRIEYMYLVRGMHMRGMEKRYPLF